MKDQRSVTDTPDKTSLVIMSPTEGETHRSLLGERLVAAIAVDLKDTVEALQMLGETHRLSVRRIDVGDRRRVIATEGTIVAGIGKELAGLGPAAPGIEDRRSRFVGEELGGRLQVAEQPFVDRPKQEGGPTHPVCERRSVEPHALARIDLSLSIKRQVIGVFGDQNLRHRRLGRNAALDQPVRGRRLDDDALAGPATVARPPCHENTELGGHDVEPLGDILADDVEPMLAARTGLVLDVDDGLDPRQMGRQGAAVRPALCRPFGLSFRVGALFFGLFDGNALFDVFETEKKLVLGQRLGPAAEAIAL